MTLNDKIDRLVSLKLLIKQYEAEAGELGAEIINAMLSRPECLRADGKISYEYFGFGRVAVETKITRTIKAELLVAAGVPVDKITEATVVTESAPYIRLYPKRE